MTIANRRVTELETLEGKVAIITGAASGMGAAKAKLFAARGAQVVATDIATFASEPSDSEALVVETLHHDVGDEASWDSVVRYALDRFGRIDVLVNNAGIYKPLSLVDTDLANWDAHYRVNQLSVFLGMRACMAHMPSGSSIINVSSVAAMGGSPGSFAYGSSKWAVRGMTKLAASELAPRGIRVNSVHPGLIDTPMIAVNGEEINRMVSAKIPLGRLGSPEDVARLALFLASDASSYITGAEVVIGGGI